MACRGQPESAGAHDVLHRHGVDKNGPYQLSIGHGLLRSDSTAWYKLEYQRCHFIGSYFISGSFGGIQNTRYESVMYAEMPYATSFPTYAEVGSGGGYSQGAQVDPNTFLTGGGQMGGPCYVQGNLLFVVDTRNRTTLNAISVSTSNISERVPGIYPVAGDSFYASGIFPIGAVVE